VVNTIAVIAKLVAATTVAIFMMVLRSANSKLEYLDSAVSQQLDSLCSSFYLPRMSTTAGGCWWCQPGNSQGRGANFRCYPTVPSNSLSRAIQRSSSALLTRYSRSLLSRENLSHDANIPRRILNG